MLCLYSSVSSAQEENEITRKCSGDTNPSVRTKASIKYPPAAVRSGATGTTLIKVTYDANGKIINTSVYKSSGNRFLDLEVKQSVMKWTLNPAIINCEPIGGEFVLTVSFSM